MSWAERGRWRTGLMLSGEPEQVAMREAKTGCPLSRRQLQVLGLYASGEAESTKEIARRLGIDVKTVHNHIAAAGRALDTSGTTQTVVCAIREGWVSLWPPAADEAA